MFFSAFPSNSVCVNTQTGLLPNMENWWPLFMEILSHTVTLYSTQGEICSSGTNKSLIFNPHPS